MIQNALILKRFRDVAIAVKERNYKVAVKRKADRVDSIIFEVMIGNISHEQMFSQIRRAGL